MGEVLAVALLIAAAASWFAFTLGRVTADHKINVNHHRLAMFSLQLRTRDNIVPILSKEERKELDTLVDEYTHLESRDLDRGRSNILTLVAMLFVAEALFLGACGGGTTLNEGKVIAKDYDDPDDWYVPGYTIHGSESCTGGYNGQPRLCTTSPDIVIPGHWDHDGEHFRLKLEAPNPDKPEKPLHDTREVSESFFNDVRVGQWVNVKTLEIVER